MIRISDGKFRKLSEQEEKFLDNVTSPAYPDDNEGLRQAWLDAGYQNTGNILAKARMKLRDMSDHVQLRVHEKIGMHVPWALQELIELAKNAKNETIKLKAIESLLNRGGYGAPIKIEHSQDDPKDMTREEILKEILYLLQKRRQNNQEKVVGGNECLSQRED